MPDNRKPLIYGAFPVCRNYTVRAHQCQLADSRPCSRYGGFWPSGPCQDQHHHRHLRRVYPFGGCSGGGRSNGCVHPHSGREPRMTGKQKYSPQRAGIIPPSLWAASFSVHCWVSSGKCLICALSTEKGWVRRCTTENKNNDDSI